MKSSDSDTPAPLSPPLKWAGGKRWLVPHIRKIFQGYQNRRLVEPFVGGMAVTLALEPTHALLNDISPHLINFYRWLARGLEVEIDFKHDREYFFLLRDRFNALSIEEKTNSKLAAELFYYLNRTCFNGLCRFNSSGGFNVPFGKYSKINYVRDFSEYKELFQSWSFECGDFESLKITSSDIIYADPPYDVEFTAYSKENFKWEDQERLVRWLTSFDLPIVASNQATDRILELYTSAGFQITTLPAPRRISCTGDRTPTLEMIATKNLGEMGGGVGD